MDTTGKGEYFQLRKIFFRHAKNRPRRPGLERLLNAEGEIQTLGIRITGICAVSILEIGKGADEPHRCAGDIAAAL